MKILDHAHRPHRYFPKISLLTVGILVLWFTTGCGEKAVDASKETQDGGGGPPPWDGRLAVDDGRLAVDDGRLAVDDGRLAPEDRTANDTALLLDARVEADSPINNPCPHQSFPPSQTTCSSAALQCLSIAKTEADQDVCLAQDPPCRACIDDSYNHCVFGEPAAPGLCAQVYGCYAGCVIAQCGTTPTVNCTQQAVTGSCSSLFQDVVACSDINAPANQACYENMAQTCFANQPPILSGGKITLTCPYAGFHQPPPITIESVPAALLPRCSTATKSCVQGAASYQAYAACLDADQTPAVAWGMETLDCAGCDLAQGSYCMASSCQSEFAAYGCCAQESGSSTACQALLQTVIACTQNQGKAVFEACLAALTVQCLP